MNPPRIRSMQDSRLQFRVPSVTLTFCSFTVTCDTELPISPCSTRGSSSIYLKCILLLFAFGEGLFRKGVRASKLPISAMGPPYSSSPYNPHVP